MSRTVNHPEFNILETTPGRIQANEQNEGPAHKPARRAAPPAADPAPRPVEKPAGRRAPPPPVKTGGRMAPPPPKPWWHRYDPYHQPGEPASGGQIPNPPEYCDARWLRGPTGINWVDAAFCASCPDSKICEGLKGYHAATNAKNNGRTHKKEWEDGTEDE